MGLNNMIDLFPVGQYDYSDEGKTKPINYNETQLRYIASTTDVVDIKDSHNSKKVIGKLTNFIFQDNMLRAEVSGDLDITGWGLSPTFSGDLVDEGEYTEFTNIKLDDVARTKTPRSNIIYNEKANNEQTEPKESVHNGDDNMGDYEPQKIIEKKDNQILDQQEQIAILKKQLEATKKEVKGYAKVEKELEETKTKLDEATKSAEDYKSDATTFREQQKTKKEELITELAGDDEEAKTQFNDLPYETLEFIKSKKVLDQDPKDIVPSNGAGNPDDDPGNPDPDPEPKKLEDMTFAEQMEYFDGKI